MAISESFCNSCGRAISVGCRSCSSCAVPLRPAEASRTGVHGPVPPGILDEVPPFVDTSMPAAGESCLVVVRGPNAGSRFMLYKHVTTLGREGDSDVLLNDVTVSRAQAEILRQDRSWVLVDCGSMNGTYVNEARIEARVRLAHGDQLQVGRFVIFFLQP